MLVGARGIRNGTDVGLARAFRADSSWIPYRLRPHGLRRGLHSFAASRLH
jgi:hypothetical protein